MRTKKSFLLSKGFYIAIILSVVAITGAAYIGINMTMNDLENQAKEIDHNEITGKNTSEIDEWEYPVDNNVKDVPDESAITGDTEDDKTEEIIKQEDEKPLLKGYKMPLDGKVINPFSNGEMVKSETLNEWRTHDGVDIKAAKTTPVMAMGSGTVKDSYIDPLWGYCVILTHSDGLESHYYGLNSNVLVNKGQKVNLGDVIGSVGQTAEIESSIDTHLHFGVKKDSNWVDPASVMTKQGSK